jgi:hypothetical protein
MATEMHFCSSLSFGRGLFARNVCNRPNAVISTIQTAEPGADRSNRATRLGGLTPDQIRLAILAINRASDLSAQKGLGKRRQKALSINVLRHRL